MDEKQERHLQQIKTNVVQWLDAKYRSGAQEHDGDLIDMTPKTLCDNAIQESLDQFCYLVTLRGKL